MKMPGLSAPETIAALRERVPGVRVLVFTSFGEDALILPPLDAPCPEIPTETHCFRRQYDRIGEAMEEQGARAWPELS